MKNISDMSDDELILEYRTSKKEAEYQNVLQSALKVLN